MVGRILTLVVTLAIALAPVAREVCDASCALHAAITADAASDHHGGHHHPGGAGEASHSQVSSVPASHHGGHGCHDVPGNVTDTGDAASGSMSGVPHSCAHSDALPLIAGTMQCAAAPPPVVAAIPVDPAPTSFVRPPAGFGTSHLSARLALIGQLRV